MNINSQYARVGMQVVIPVAFYSVGKFFLRNGGAAYGERIVYSIFRNTIASSNLYQLRVSMLCITISSLSQIISILTRVNKERIIDYHGAFDGISVTLISYLFLTGRIHALSAAIIGGLQVISSGGIGM